MEYQIISVLIPLLTIILAIITKDVIVSLIGGIFVGFLVLHDYHIWAAFVALLDGVIGIFAEGWMAKTILFVMLVGSIIAILQKSGAVDEFVSFLSQKATSIDSPVGAMMLAYIIGLVIFIESSITVLVAGVVSRPLFDKHKVSREKLAYICDSTSAPVCSLIPLNGWGALFLGLITAAISSGVITGDPLQLLIRSLVFNFYAIVAVALVALFISGKLLIGPMRYASSQVDTPNTTSRYIPDATPWRMVIVLVFLVCAVFAALYITGDKDIFQGSGSTSVYYAVVSTLVLCYLLFVPTRRLSHKGFFEAFYEGLAMMLPLGLVMILAFLIGKVVGDLGTAHYLGSLIEGNLPLFIVPVLVFWIASLTAFATGTSWGTFSVMMPIALALGGSMELSIPLMIGAVISGGVFGDHASPISDTTIISSMAAGCEPIEHVRTQLPYALLSAFLATLLFLIAGAWLAP